MLKKILIPLMGLTLTQIHAQDDTDNAKMAKALANPVSTLISVPFQFNYDRGYFDQGSKSTQTTLNIQPVVPFSLNENWNLVSRTIMPISRIDDVPPSSGINGGIGDIVQSIFLSPKLPTKSHWIWGAGPVFLIPSNSDISARKWGAGIAAVVLRQDKALTYGIHANHIESFAGSNALTDKISQTLLQPFFTYTTPKGISYSIGSETTYNHEASKDNWTVPVLLTASKVDTIGTQRISYGCVLKYYATSPQSGPQGFGLRAFVTFMFPQ